MGGRGTLPLFVFLEYEKIHFSFILKTVNHENHRFYYLSLGCGFKT